MIAAICALLRAVAACLVAVGAAVATIQWWIPAFIYQPAALARLDPAAWGLPDAAAMRADAGERATITGWWQAPADPRCPVALVVHGRSANIATRAPVMRSLSRDAIGVLMFNYRGYGANLGALAARLLWLSVEVLPWRRNRFDVVARLRRFGGPTLLVASAADGLVTPGNAARVRAAVPRSRSIDASLLRHDGMLRGVADDGRLTAGIRALVPCARV